MNLPKVLRKFEYMELLELQETLNSAIKEYNRVSIENIGLSPGVKHFLGLNKIEYLHELSAYSRFEFSKCRNVGQKTLAEFDALLKKHGLRWGDDSDVVRKIWIDC